MKKVLMMGPLHPPTGGMETVMEQTKSMKMKEYKLVMFNTNKNKIIKSFVLFNIINFIYRCMKLFFLLIMSNIDIVHIHTASKKSFWQNAIYLKISKMLKKTTILHIHGAEFKEFFRSSNKTDYITKILDSADALIVLSDSWKDFYSKISDNKNIFVMNNAIENIDFKKYKRIYPNENFIVLFLSSICKRKGAYDLLKSIKQIKNPEIRFVFVGPYEDPKKFFSETKKLGINDRCEFIGEVIGKERFKYFASADVFVLPSYAEGLPVAILEALSFGLPIISTTVGAIPEVIDKENGILIKPGDIKSLKNAILEIQKNKKVINYKKNNVKKMSNNYTQKIFTKNLERTYESLK
jgi:glycosyltransferase involved in cell wall biosynthesis